MASRRRLWAVRPRQVRACRRITHSVYTYHPSIHPYYAIHLHLHLHPHLHPHLHLHPRTSPPSHHKRPCRYLSLLARAGLSIATDLMRGRRGGAGRGGVEAVGLVRMRDFFLFVLFRFFFVLSPLRPLRNFFSVFCLLVAREVIPARGTLVRRAGALALPSYVRSFRGGALQRACVRACVGRSCLDRSIRATWGLTGDSSILRDITSRYLQYPLYLLPCCLALSINRASSFN